MNADKLKDFLDELRSEKHDRAQELKEDDFKFRNGFLGQDEEY